MTLAAEQGLQTAAPALSVRTARRSRPLLILGVLALAVTSIGTGVFSLAYFTSQTTVGMPPFLAAGAAAAAAGAVGGSFFFAAAVDAVAFGAVGGSALRDERLRTALNEYGQ